MKVPSIIAAGSLLAAVTLSASQLVVPGRAGMPTPARLVPTAHPAVPSELSAMWLVPDQTAKPGPAMTNFIRGVRLLEEEDRAAAALPLVSDAALSATPLADYARYYTGITLLKLERHAEAATVFADLAARNIEGHLPEDAAFRLGEVREAQKDDKGAVAVYEALLLKKLAQPQMAWLKLGQAAERAGMPMRSVEALQRVYYDYPTSSQAAEAGLALDRQDVEVDEASAPKELARADALFQARRWAEARRSYDRVKSLLSGSRRDRVMMRIAAADVGLGRHRDGRDALRAHLSGPHAEEAHFHFVTAARGLKLADEHIRLSRAYVDKYPSSPFAEEILNNLASAYIIDDRDDDADQVFREILARFPAGRFAERAAWKAGWAAYRKGQFTDALQYFDRGAAQFPRSDYRPAWLYWSGRAAQQAGDIETGIARLRLAATDYHNSYYGRLALTRLEGGRGRTVTPTLQRQADSAQLRQAAAIPTAGRITALLSVGLNREAMSELQYAQRVWGDSPQLQATMAVVHRRRDAAGRDPQGDLPGRLLAAAAEVLAGAQPRSLPGRRAHRPGIQLRPGRRLARQRLRPDADPAEHRPQLCQEARHPSVLDAPAQGSRGQRAHRHADLRRRDPQVRRRPLRAGRLQRRRQPRDPLAAREARLAAGRVHRRHPVPRDAELREAHSRHRRGLQVLV
jgi:TolA-binding protein